MISLETAVRAAGSPLHLTENGFEKTFVFPPDFVGFDGHFPGAPILPAVVQLMAGAQAAAEALSQLRAGHYTVSGVMRAKFLKPVEPDEQLVVTGTLTEDGAAPYAVVRILSGEDAVSHFRVTFSEVKP
ncbi:3-hydroxyacyl-ACP dehydratase [Desulfovibrio sp. Huiquan2017]|uniref:3-hydroxyacyl-ACP dehydratase n=1 Tax=Desulfovibrio sp. Huiquan2017 TaxID=2816861 RepID=UPI001A92A616|nr:3-hydroxyacyl-ACP dehydratase [Desulfovibrio sp. Huiquan2017]